MKRYLIDDIRNSMFDKVNSPSCEVCEFYFSSVRAAIKSNNYEETLCLCEDCYMNLELPRDQFAESKYIIIAIEERF